MKRNAVVALGHRVCNSKSESGGFEYHTGNKIISFPRFGVEAKHDVEFRHSIGNASRFWRKVWNGSVLIQDFQVPSANTAMCRVHRKVKIKEQNSITRHKKYGLWICSIINNHKKLGQVRRQIAENKLGKQITLKIPFLPKHICNLVSIKFTYKS